MNKIIFNAAIALALSVPYGAALASDAIRIDIDGSAATTGGDAGGNAVQTYGSFDYAPGSALILDATSISLGSDVQLYSHSNLTGTDIGTPTGLDVFPSTTPTSDLFQITYVMGAVENVASFSPTQSAATGTENGHNTYIINTSATFDLGSGGDNFFELWYDNTTAANPDGGLEYNQLAGTGFRDGTMILSGTIDTLSGNFATTGTYGLFEYVDNNDNGVFDGGDTLSANFIGDGTSADFYPLLDSYLADDWSSVITYLSVKGQGSTSFTIAVDFADDDFFIDEMTYLTFDLDFTTEVRDPFIAVDPSQSFQDEAGTVLVAGTDYILGDSAGGLCGQNIICNGVEGPDQLLQADASNNFLISVERVPEPSTLALMGLSLATLGVFSRSRRRRSVK